MTIEQLSLFDYNGEDPKYLSEQIITYIGNKRALLGFIGGALSHVKKQLNKNKLITFDVFSGSGIVSRFLKQYSDVLYCNDLEDYATTISKCYLSNKSTINFDELNKYYHQTINAIEKTQLLGFFSELYAPKDDRNIKVGERVFYTLKALQKFKMFGCLMGISWTLYLEDLKQLRRVILLL